jgi:DNA repair protein RadC
MRIADLPVLDRPRERLSSVGPAALADRELLAMMLGTGGARGAGAHDLAERLLSTFGSVGELARAHPADLVGVAGIGPAKASAVVAAFELARRVSRPTTAPTLHSTSDLLAMVGPYLRGRTRERLVLVVCDAGHRVTSCEVLTEGAADRAILAVREIAVGVLRRDGKAFALAHNHPTGDPLPSEADIEATLRVEDAAQALGLRFLDHLVITDDSWARVPRSNGVEEER